LSFTLAETLKKFQAGAPARLADAEALELLRCDDLMGLGRAANAVRRSLHPDNFVTFIADRNINYTNICVSRCKFCAFWRNSEEGYVLSKEELARKVRETVEAGGTQILLQGGLHPDLRLDFYIDLVRFIKGNFSIHVHAFSPPEIIHFARLNAMPVRQVIAELREAGLDSIPGGGAEILSDSVRSHVSPHKCTADEWTAVMREAHLLGMRTTATMMFGHAESLFERVEHLRRIRDLQDETKGFTAFIPWTFQPGNTALAAEAADESGKTSVGGFEYLRTLAVSRLYLDNVPNIQASWVTQGLKIAQLALFFGANDMGGTMMEENVVRAAGVNFRANSAEILYVIKSAGFTPARRDTLYNLLEIL
jgi:cyclic dehypoxanthinyl futalosine synthase